MAYVFLSVQVFHKHLKAMLASMFVNFYILAFCRVILILVSGFDPRLAYAPDRDSFTDFLNFLEIMKYIMCNCFTLSLPLLVAERTIATLKLHDYEKTVYKFCLPAAVMTSWICGGLAGMIARLGDPCFYAVMTFEISINIVAICPINFPFQG
uniref:Olfactory receptor n=1 Tax=Panagrolaimus sp. JU765 TaxID=591449 RepID=A0AC34R419_9BILA